jgi:Tfp pilus assembly protein PilZ
MLNVSKNGVQFRTTEPLGVGETLFMTLRFPNVFKPVKVKAEVCWCKDEKKVGVENYTNIIGTHLTEYNPDSRDLIAAAMR